jgi:hypothetical protein
MAPFRARRKRSGMRGPLSKGPLGSNVFEPSLGDFVKCFAHGE